MNLPSAFPTEYVDRTDPKYREIPWYQFVLIPGKDGSSLQDFNRCTEDLQSAPAVKAIRDKHAQHCRSTRHDVPFAAQHLR